MTDLNCHFVSRFLTKPWEHGQRELHYFDFTDGKVKTGFSRTLFAEVGTNSREVEQRLNQVIETPISQALTQLGAPQAASGQRGLVWPVFRALTLLMMLQPLRLPGNAARNETLEETVLKSDKELDEIAQAASQRYQLGRFTVRPDAALLYPESGFFPIVAEDDRGAWRACIAVPIALQHVMVAVPREVDWDQASRIWSANGSGALSNSSVGTSDRVVLPPAHVDATKPEDIAKAVTEMRQLATEQLDLCRELNNALARLEAM